MPANEAFFKIFESRQHVVGLEIAVDPAREGAKFVGDLETEIARSCEVETAYMCRVKPVEDLQKHIRRDFIESSRHVIGCSGQKSTERARQTNFLTLAGPLHVYRISYAASDRFQHSSKPLSHSSYSL